MNANAKSTLRRGLSALLCLAMLAGLGMPALAAESDSVAEVSENIAAISPVNAIIPRTASDGLKNNEDIVTDKTLAYDEATGEYTIKIESYVTGSTVTTSTLESVATDFVLAVDNSNSMKYCVYDGATGLGATAIHVIGSENVKKDKTYYLDTARTKPVTYCLECDGWFDEVHDTSSHGGQRYVPTLQAWAKFNLYHSQFYVDSQLTTPVYKADLVLDEETLYYMKRSDDNVVCSVGYCDDCKAWFYGTASYWGQHKNGIHTAGNRVYYPLESPNQDWSYVHFRRPCQSRLDAAKEAINAFLDQIQFDALGNDGVAGTKDDVAHRIAIVSFSGPNKTGVYSVDGDVTNSTYTMAEAEADQNIYKNAMRSVLDADEWDILQTAVVNLTHEFGTQTDSAVEMSHDILEHSNAKNKVVIVFTDGYPNHTGNQNFDSVSVGESIYWSNELKKDEAKIYTVGIFDDANNSAISPLPGNSGNVNKANTFMHLISSNYKDTVTTLEATYSIEDVNKDLTEVVNGTRQLKEKAVTELNHYLTASTTEGLINAFQSIANSSSEGGSSIVSLDSQTFLQDIVSDSFVIPDASKVVAYTMAYGVDADGNDTWTKDPDSVSHKDDENSPLDVEVDGQDVTVTNFDYATNYVGIDTTIDTAGNVTATPHGKKVVLEIPIKLAEDAVGAEHVATNDPYNSGVFYEGELLESLPIPHVDIPTKVTVTKKVFGVDSADQTKFDFTAKYEDWAYASTNEETPNSTYLKAEKEADASATFKLGNGESETISNVMIGSEMTIGEIPGNFDVTIKDGNGRTLPIDISDDGTTYSATFTVAVDMKIEFTNINSHAVQDTAVIDYGEPVDITVLKNDIIGGTFKSLSLEDGETADGRYGSAAVNGEQIRYTLGSMGMKSEDRFTYIVAYTNTANVNKTVQGVLTVVPANNIYYEDDFVTNDKDDTNGTCGIYYSGNWIEDGTKQNDNENHEAAEDETNGGVHGWEDNLADDTGYSDGSGHYADASKQEGSAYATATFTFTGKGVDIYGRTNNKTGTVLGRLDSKNADGTIAKSKILIVDTVSESGDYYQIPTLSFMDLPYGTYTVTITVTKGAANDGDGRFIYYLDGIRVYNPLADDSVYPEKEQNAIFKEVRDILLDAKTFDANTNDSIAGVVFIDELTTEQAPSGTTASTPTTTNVIGVYEDYGPKNEVYLKAGQAITFSVEELEGQYFYIGLKAPNINGNQGEYSGTAVATVSNGKDAAGEDVNKEITVDHSTDMYYEVMPHTNGFITIKNTGDGLLSVTKIRTTGTAGDAQILSITQEEALDAVAAFSLRSVVENEEEPVDPETPDVEIDNPTDTDNTLTGHKVQAQIKSLLKTLFKNLIGWFN